MELLPEYCENIIVGVIYKNIFSWYVTKTDIWYLDYDKKYNMLKQYYSDMGRSRKRFEHEVGSLEYFCGSRWGIKIIDSKADIDKFLSKIEKYKVTCDELKEYRSIADNLNDFAPALLINFDKKHLYSYIPEPYSFHKFVPDGWQGTYENFYSLIPREQVFFE